MFSEGRADQDATMKTSIFYENESQSFLANISSLIADAKLNDASIKLSSLSRKGKRKENISRYHVEAGLLSTSVPRISPLPFSGKRGYTSALYSYFNQPWIFQKIDNIVHLLNNQGSLLSVPNFHFFPCSSKGIHNLKIKKIIIK